MRQDIHTLPVDTASDHINKGLNCWCSPRYLLPCDECETGCWKCEGGSIPLTHQEAVESVRSIVIVHNR